MKTFMFFIGLISFSAFMSTVDKKKNSIKNFEELIAKYEGRENEMFKFVDENQIELYFDEVSEIVEVNLFDEKSIGKEFLLSWEEEIIEVYDEEGENTGETQTIRTITKLEEIKKNN